MPDLSNLIITPDILKLIADIDEFKGRWTAVESLAPEKLSTLRRIATIESVGWELFRMMLDVASGRKKTWADHWGLHNEMALFNPGPVT